MQLKSRTAKRSIIQSWIQLYRLRSIMHTLITACTASRILPMGF